jgi:hypothetical protein
VASEGRPPIPTTPREHDYRLQQHARLGRRVFVVVVAVFLVATLLGFVGERARTTSTVSDDYQVVVHYPQVTRPGLSSSLEFEIRRTDGQPLPEQVTLETTADYLRMWDDHAVEPTPDVMRGDDEDTVWIMLPESGATELRVYLDGRIDPGLSWGRSGSTTLYAGDEQIATLDYRTWIVP